MRPYLENKSNLIYKSKNDHSYDYPSHFHNNLEIAYCFYGKQGIWIGETDYVLGQGDAAVIFPNITHEYFKATDENTGNISLICNTRLLSELLPETVTKYSESPYVRASETSPNIALAFENIAKTKNEAQMLGWTYIILQELLSRLTLESRDGDRDLPARVVEYIDQNFKEPLTIEYLSHAFGYHPSYIAHVFCDQLKISFRAYLGAVRAEYAAAQIRTTQKSLTEIAYDSGCNSLNTFCRCFKKHFGMTPSQYKKHINEKKAETDAI